MVIESINSRGQTGSAAIGIPTSEIPRVVGMLMDAYQSILNEECKPFVIEPAPTTGECTFPFSEEARGSRPHCGIWLSHRDGKPISSNEGKTYVAIGNIQNYHEATPEEARRAIRGLDGVDTVPLYRVRGDAYEAIENIFGVRNTATDKITMSVSGRYKPLSHLDGFTPVLDAIEHADIGHDMMVSLEDHNDTAQLYVLFPSLMFNEDRDGGGMMYGFRFKNQYDAKTAFRGHVFCWRVLCKNGSTHARLGELQVSAMHVDSHIKPPGKIDEFIWVCSRRHGSSVDR